MERSTRLEFQCFLGWGGGSKPSEAAMWQLQVGGSQERICSHQLCLKTDSDQDTSHVGGTLGQFHNEAMDSIDVTTDRDPWL